MHRLYGGENAFLLAEYVRALEQADLSLIKVLGPLESEINFAPHTLASLHAEIARRAGRLLPGAGSAVLDPARGAGHMAHGATPCVGVR